MTHIPDFDDVIILHQTAGLLRFIKQKQGYERYRVATNGRFVPDGFVYALAFKRLMESSMEVWVRALGKGDK